MSLCQACEHAAEHQVTYTDARLCGDGTQRYTALLCGPCMLHLQHQASLFILPTIEQIRPVPSAAA